SFREKIVLVGVVTPDTTPDVVEASLDELALLVDTAGADVVARVVLASRLRHRRVRQ
ncbi:MAG: GTPase HflX, partial [Actinomycetota bacterium]